MICYLLALNKDLAKLKIGHYCMILLVLKHQLIT